MRGRNSSSGIIVLHLSSSSFSFSSSGVFPETWKTSCSRRSEQNSGKLLFEPAPDDDG